MSQSNSDNPSRSPDRIDQERLSELHELVLELRGKGNPDSLDEVLAGLSEVERTMYARVLRDRLAESLEPTIHSEMPSGDELNDTTVELPHSNGISDIQDESLQPSARSASPSELESQHDQFESSLPQRIGKFRIKKELGRGAFGVVYLGFDEELQRHVAVKVSLVSDPKLQERLRVEAAKLAQAESPGIVPVYHIGRTQEGKVYIVQKYIEGSTLRDLLREHPLSPLATVALLREIALGLGPAHAMDILHRDLKPDNILIEASGKAWIADFGLAISEDEQINHRRELAGTPPYMSPEQIRGRVDFLDPRSDIWALGVMFYELLTGKLPFNGKERKQIAEQICELDPRPLHQRAPGLLTEAMNEVFRRCCAKKPSDRYATVSELVDALDQLACQGLSDQNIYGQQTLVIGDLASDPNTGVLGSTRNATRRFSTRALGQSQTTRATARMSSRTLSERVTRRVTVWGLAAVVLGSSVICIVGYHLYSQKPAAIQPSGSQDVTTSLNQALAAPTSSQAPGIPGTASPATDPTGMRPPDEASRVATLRKRRDDESSSTFDLATRRESHPEERLGDGSQQRPWIVAPGESGTHTTIEAAIAEASSGDFIHVMPGLYRERLLITKPITIDGEPPKSSVYPSVIENDQQSPLTIDCADGVVTIRSLMISGKGHRSTSEFNPIEVRGGSLHIESCALETRSQNCVKVRGSATLDATACKFIDSNEFAISAMDFSQVSITGCDFLCSGIEVTGGTGNVNACKFYGKAGIYVANNLNPVEVSNCLFDENRERSLLATDGGNLVITGATIQGSTTGVEATDKPMTAESPISGKPGHVVLVQSKLQKCTVGLQINGGSLEASDDCFIDGGQIGVGVSTGVALLSEVSISRIKEKAIVIYQGGDVTLRKCNISGCDQTAVKISHGKLTYDGGAIEDFALYGIMMGDDQSSDRNELIVSLRDMLIRSTQSKLAGLAAFDGRLEMRNVIVDGAAYGVYIKGTKTEHESVEQPSIDVTAFESRFKNQTGYGAVVLGDARFVMDQATSASLNASKGLKAAPPAEVVIDARAN